MIDLVQLQTSLWGLDSIPLLNGRVSERQSRLGSIHASFEL